jgi:hypothetical protein
LRFDTYWPLHYNFIIRPDNKEAEQSFIVSISNKITNEAEAA